MSAIVGAHVEQGWVDCFWPFASFRCRAAPRSLSEGSGHRLTGKARPFGREWPNSDIGSRLRPAAWPP